MSAIFKRILVPLDGSRLAESALPPAVSIAQCFKATLILIHIIEQSAPGTVHGDRHLSDAKESEHYLQEVVQRYAASGLKIEWHTHPDAERNVAASIVAHADELGIDLIALCTHGRGGVRDWIWGSIAQQVLKRGTTPVLLTNPGPGDEPVSTKPYQIHKLLVSLDGSHDGEIVLPVVSALEECNPGEINFLIVVPTLETVSDLSRVANQLSPLTAKTMLDLEHQDAVDYLEKIAAGYRSAGYTVGAKVLRGDAEQGLVDEVHSTHADLLILATHGRAGFDSLWSGSIGANIVRHLPIPVLLIRIVAPRSATG